MAGHTDSASFEKPAEAYDRFVGRYGPQLAQGMIGRVGVERGWSVLDVGCGPGALTGALAEAVGTGRVAAVDPSESFTAACRARVPSAEVTLASAESLPFPDDAFDAAMSQLVVNFMADAPTGVREMRRVTRPGGTVAASVWDYAGGMTMLRTFWEAAGALDPTRATLLDEGNRMPYCEPDSLAALLTDAGLRDVAAEPLVVRAAYRDFADLWEPFTAGIGPAGAYCTSLDDQGRQALEAEFSARLGSPDGPFELSARAWLARGTV